MVCEVRSSVCRSVRILFDVGRPPPRPGYGVGKSNRTPANGAFPHPGVLFDISFKHAFFGAQNGCRPFKQNSCLNFQRRLVETTPPSHNSNRTSNHTVPSPQNFWLNCGSMPAMPAMPANSNRASTPFPPASRRRALVTCPRRRPRHQTRYGCPGAASASWRRRCQTPRPCSGWCTSRAACPSSP